MLLYNFTKLAAFIFGGETAWENGWMRPYTTTNSSGSRFILIRDQQDPSPLTSNYYTDTGAGGYPGIQYQGIAFGSGTTPPTINDIKLENFINSGLSYGAANIDSTSVQGVITYSQVVTNTSTEDITINEVALFTKNGNQVDYATVIFTRSVIEPLILKPNDTKVVVLKIDFRTLTENISNT